ncbi:MAG: hypothetical protein QXS50_07055 [Candidatus Caldarchaeum sp.]
MRSRAKAIRRLKKSLKHIMAARQELAFAPDRIRGRLPTAQTIVRDVLFELVWEPDAPPSTDVQAQPQPMSDEDVLTALAAEEGDGRSRQEAYDADYYCYPC